MVADRRGALRTGCHLRRLYVVRVMGRLDGLGLHIELALFPVPGGASLRGQAQLPGVTFVTRLRFTDDDSKLSPDIISHFPTAQCCQPFSRRFFR